MTIAAATGTGPEDRFWKPGLEMDGLAISAVC